MNFYAANSLALAGGVRGLWFFTSVPRAAALSRILCMALEKYLRQAIPYIKKSVHVYSGGGIKYDGHYDIATRTGVPGKDTASDKWIIVYPYSVLNGWVALDGALLTWVTAGRTEDWPDIEPVLDVLIDEITANRAEAGLPLPAQVPSSHSVDTYGQHRLLLEQFYERKRRASSLRAITHTPKGDAIAVAIPDHPCCDTEITGEPMHDCFALRRLTSQQRMTAAISSATIGMG